MSLTFVDLCAGLGGFHKALVALGHECVYASEIDAELRALYEQNFPSLKGAIYGDIRESRNKEALPPHQILCVGFPCQPFSKSGSQIGLADPTQGTIFHEIVEILQRHQPEYVILENVGNFERHDDGRTWRIVQESLKALDYHVRGTTHKASGGLGLLSPHHLGFPHTRERFFIVGRRVKPLPENPFFVPDRSCVTSLSNIIQSEDTLTAEDIKETSLTLSQRECIEHWNEMLASLPRDTRLPSFPIWGDELDAEYPYERYTPYAASIKELRRCLRRYALEPCMTRNALLSLLPSYARTQEEVFPVWKVQFIRQNREWLKACRKYLSDEWVERLKSFPPSLRKFEWNCKGEERDLWKHVLQFRPSGLRVKRFSSSPALVAMTSTQIPLLGPQRRFLTRREGLRLQGFPDDHALPDSRTRAFKALGNAVHIGVVTEIAKRLIVAEQPGRVAIVKDSKLTHSLPTPEYRHEVSSIDYRPGS